MEVRERRGASASAAAAVSGSCGVVVLRRGATTTAAPELEGFLDDACLDEDESSLAPPGTPAEEEHGVDEELSLPARAAEQAEHLVRKVLEEAEQAEQLVRKVWEEAWKVCHFSSLPQWLQDNDFLHRGHRPPLPSFSACFRSIFRIHTETGNIWTHLLGCLAFVGMATYFLTRPSAEIQWQEKVVFASFFAGAIMCMGMSFTFHTVSCHSEKVGKLFSKLDYCGIALLIIGSFVPWLYYGFYCDTQPKLIYLTVVVVLGIAAVVVSLWDKFGEPRYRPLRAGVFTGFGLSGVVPALHYLFAEGFLSAVYEASFGWLCLMGALYIAGALFYALRVPERWFPGKCDILVSFASASTPSTLSAAHMSRNGGIFLLFRCFRFTDVSYI